MPAPGPPARALATGSERREYPLLRGAIVKLAHDDPATAAALLVALLPAQGAAIEGPLGYDLTIREAGTFAVAIAGGRASVEQIDFPRPRGIAEFHLTADAVVLCELLAGVEHRIGRFFGPARVRGRKRRVKELRALAASTATRRRGRARRRAPGSRPRLPAARLRDPSDLDARARLHDRPGDHRRAAGDLVPDRARRRRRDGLRPRPPRSRRTRRSR